jgi:hypothetical protein
MMMTTTKTICGARTARASCTQSVLQRAQPLDLHDSQDYYYSFAAA